MGPLHLDPLGRRRRRDGKSLVVHSDRLYRVFQDYWDPSDAVEYVVEGNYKDGRPVPGSNTGGGRKRLTVRPDDSLSLENTNWSDSSWRREIHLVPPPLSPEFQKPLSGCRAPGRPETTVEFYGSPGHAHRDYRRSAVGAGRRHTAA
ncbi:hypothetical protein GCM10017673_45810 [Streptosporangium violaceochromogenes]|nr:hypothetical protein GCM10017673_45810 [Streptosporangium violaceochromogenes]